MNKFFKKFVAVILGICLLVTSILPILNSSSKVVQKAQAQESCSPDYMDPRAYLSSRVGGVALDQAAVFLADMTDITGAYYDTDQDRIVFVGKDNTSAPKFDKDDLAVAIKALVFKNHIPAVSMEFKDPNNMFGPEYLNVLYYGGIEDTSFGKVLVEADYKMKQYAQGYNENGQKIVSSVPGYKSHFDRFLEKGPTPNVGSYSRWWISPQLITVKKDDSSKSFVFDQVKMQIETEGLWSTNDPKWNQAAVEFAQQQTDLYDQFALETPSYAQAKQLAKVVGVVKWIEDNNIVNNFEWARDYQPKYISTPREIKRLTTPSVSVGDRTWRMTGGVTYDEPNTYNPDNGTASGLKNSSEAVGTSSETNHWTFVNGGVQYNAVAVEANAFRSLGAFSTTASDMEFPTQGSQTLSFTRSYSSFSGGQKGIGRGWGFLPATLYDNKTGWYVNCTTGAVGKHPYKLGFIGPDGFNESFTYTSCSTGYSADKPEYHTKIIHNSDDTFTAKLTDQTEYIFDANFKLISSKDKIGNKITYSYDSSGKVASVTDSGGHTLNLSYNPSGLVSSVSDWTGRKVQYSYDVQSNLTAVIDPKGNTTKYEYDANNKLSKIINRLGQVVTENTYTLDSKLASQKNASGVLINFNYNEATKTITAQDSNGRVGKALYDDKARITEATDALNNSLKYTYGIEYSPLTATDKRNNKMTFTYDLKGNLTSITYPDLKKISYTYDSKNQLTKVSDGRYPTAKVTTNTFDSLGNLTQINEAGILTKFGYDSYGEVLNTTDHMNNSTSFTRDSFGNIVSKKDPYVSEKKYEYDLLARLTKQTDEENKIIQYSYDPNGNLISITNSSGINRYEYNPENLVSKSTSPIGAVTDYSYNSSNSLTQVRDATGTTTSYGYDAYQNLIAQQDGLNNTTSYAYDNLNRNTQETFPMGEVTKLEYDPNGNITKKIDAQGRSITYSYDLLNRLTKITYPTSSVAFTYDYRGNLTKMADSIGTTTYTYDNFDRLTKVTNPYSRNIYYAYDSLGRLTKITYPDSKTAQYTYDNNSNLTSVSDWNSNKINYSYFKNNLLASEALPNGIKASYLYDSSNRLSSLEYSKSGGVLTKFSYERDSLGNITKVIEEGSFFSAASPTPTPTSTPTLSPTPSVGPSLTPTPTLTPSVSPTPTPIGGQPDLIITDISITKPNPAVNEYFDINVKVKNIGGTATAASFSVGIYYDLTEAPTYSTFYPDYIAYLSSVPAGAEVTLTETYERFSSSGTHNIWALVDRSQRISESNDTNNVFGPYNVNVIASSGNFFEKIAGTPLIKTVSRIFAVPKIYAQTAQLISNFTYDSLGRLTSVNYPNGENYSYSYDNTHNRISQAINGQITNYTFNANSQLTKIGEFPLSYNSNGSLTSKNVAGGTHSFTYDNEERLTAFTLSSGSILKFGYDGLGNRLYKTVGSTTTRFVNDVAGPLTNVLAETNSSNTIQKYYLYGVGMLSQGGSSSSSRQYLITDGQGNVRFLTDSSGNKVRSYSYDPFGNLLATNGTQDGIYRFSGEQNDTESALYFLRARYYDPQTGRFISRDPIKGTMMDSRTQNPYVYTANNPINYSDPSGEFWMELVERYGPSIGTKLTQFGQRCIQGGQKILNYLTKPSTTSIEQSIPKVSDPKLNNIVNDLYKGVGAPNQIGSGSTADAIRSELSTGKPTYDTFHIEKGQQYIRALDKWIRNNPNSSENDKKTAEFLLNDLRNALSGK